jgi:hypothetical protein
LEKIIKFHLENTLGNNFVLDDHQFAYCNSLGTEQAVRKATEYIEKIKERNRHVILISFDISGTFDKVRWSKILGNLCENLIPQTLINMVKSFLTERTIGHYDNQGDQITQRNLYCGVPQGSILGPILFNTIMTKVHNIPYYRDANDILLIAGVNEPHEADFRKINKIISILSHEINLADLAFNEGKTQCLLISNKHNRKMVTPEIEANIKGKQK